MQTTAQLENTEPTGRAFTVKSILFSLLGVIAITGLANIQWNMINPYPPMIGNHLPAGVFFYVVIVVFCWNGLVGRLFPRLRMTTRELTVVLAASLIAAFPPTSGLFRYFHRQIMLPWFYLGTGGKPDWQTLDILSYLPGRMFPQPVPQYVDGVLVMDETIYRGFFTGMLHGDSTIAITELPWQSWLTPLLFWGPLVLVYSVGVMALSLVVHQQWVRHEQLSYPIAQVATAFVKRARGVGIPDIFRSKLFWWGFIPIFLLYVIEYVHVIFPEQIPPLSEIFPNLRSWRLEIVGKWPDIRKVPLWWGFRACGLYFCIVGLSYFVSSDISLSLGISHLVAMIFGVWFFKSTGTPLTDTQVSMFRAGGYLAFGGILLFTGRTYYWAVIRKALFCGKPTDHDAASVMAARVFLLCMLGFVILLSASGLDWFIAILFTLILTLMFLVLTRLVCEAGIPFIQSGWAPGSLLGSLLGPAAMGPRPLVWIGYLGTVLAQDPRECLMPYAATALKAMDDAKIRLRRGFWFLVVMLVAAVAVGFVTSHWVLYNYGGSGMDALASVGVPQQCFDASANSITELVNLDLMARSSETSGLAKLGLLSPVSEDISPFVIGILLVLLCSLLRFRFTRFPLHPAIFMVMYSFPNAKIWYSFLIGWCVKTLIVRFGGGKVYQHLKPVFIGIITAELVTVGAAITISLITYAITGEAKGIGFGILPE